MSGSRICPVPAAWERVRAALEAARATTAPDAPPVPVPLILAGWTFSSDDDKRSRWAATVEWADKHGLAQAIPKLGASDWYCGD
jgi:hypothetical protein